MTIKHYPKRVHGLKEDFNATAPLLNGIGGWKEVGRTTLGGTASAIDVSSIADKRYYHVLFSGLSGGTAIENLIRVGNSSLDTGTNYSQRNSLDGASDGTLVSQAQANNNGLGGVTQDFFSHSYIANRSANEKLGMTWTTSSTATGSAATMYRTENVWKWDNTSNPIDIISHYEARAGSYQSGSEVVVLGWDESDTHTNNFWEELASVDSTGDQTVSFTPKKYLWIQNYREGTSGMDFRVGNGSIDTGSNYADRYSNDGGADTTRTSVSGWLTNWEYDTLPVFQNMFIINNASNEKLMLGHRVWQRTAAATTAPSRGEFVGKWDDTSNQIDRIQVYATSGTIGTNIIKVWGAD